MTKLSTLIRNKKFLFYLNRGWTPKEVAARFHVSVHVVYDCRRIGRERRTVKRGGRRENEGN